MADPKVESFNRAVAAINARDVDAVLEELDPGVEWHDVFTLMLGGKATVHRGHAGVRKLFEDLFDAFSHTHSEYPDVRAQGDRVIATGTLRARGHESGASIDTPVGTIAAFRGDKATQVRTFLDPGDDFGVAEAF